MRRVIALAVVAVATVSLAPSAHATCMYREDKVTGISQTSCSPPGGPVTTTTCFRDLVCYTTTSGGEPGGGA